MQRHALGTGGRGSHTVANVAECWLASKSPSRGYIHRPISPLAFLRLLWLICSVKPRPVKQYYAKFNVAILVQLT